MQAVQKIFIGFVAFCATLGAAIGVLFYIAATPYIWLIGKFVAGLFITALLCASGYSVVWTFTEMSIRLSKRRQAKNAAGMISVPADKHSIYLKPVDATYTIHEVSVNIAAASVPRMLPAPVDEEPLEPNEADIIQMYNDGQVTQAQIAESLHMMPWKVQIILAQAKKRGLIHRK